METENENPIGLTLSSEKQDCGCKISECDDVEFLRESVDKLWQIIDDIDTLSDIAKDNDKWYRRCVEARQKRRWETGIVCDGYSLYRQPGS